SILGLLRHAVLQHRLLATDFLQGQFAALVVELLEPVEAVAAVAIILQAWLTLPSCLASSSRPTLARMIFCSVVMVSSNAPRRGPSPPGPLRAPPWSAIRRGDQDTSVRLSFSQCTSSDGRFALFSAPSTAAFSGASRLSNSSDILLFDIFRDAPTAVGRLLRAPGSKVLEPVEAMASRNKSLAQMNKSLERAQSD